ncbi:TsaC protein (YrdC domain) required for threonylcarbamoyladenosine t(6)A37 modification in tRNA [uncultured Candidatus Thioglobus sp.]|nr:TsaC protein (YrdC domain) required for threonylcarbamoyladenosine t(6)A37 modification in tRNA [uncultured Candidatus Thioglobus sp.]
MTFKIQLAATALNAGGVISNPTDSIQGLTCLPYQDAMQRMIALKHRSANKGLILLASNLCFFEDFVADIDLLKKLHKQKQPTTYLLKANKYAPKLITGGFDTIALRLTDNILIDELCLRCNSALVSSSANISGKRTADSILQLNVQFKQELDFIIAPKNYNNQPSKIINLETGQQIR